jgi:prepilin-type N-terminal cleavage/methylation domain-containing protein
MTLPSTPSPLHAPASSSLPRPRMHSPTSRDSAAKRGFTIVELLATIAIIAALMGLLLVGLQSARKAMKTTKEKGNIKQLYQAWVSYANVYDDAAMPGYLEEDVQTSWKVSWKGSDKKTTIPAQYCATYPHRLLGYLDHAHDVLYDYMEATDDTFFHPTDENGNLNVTGVKAMSLNPAFGYNAYYIGGWWRQVDGAPRLRFGNASWKDRENLGHRGGVVALKSTGFERPSSMIVFCGSALRATGTYKADPEGAKGSAWVVPHTLAEEPMWLPWDGTTFDGMSGSSHASLETLMPTLAQVTSFTLAQATTGIGIRVQGQGETGVPFKRYGPQVSVVHADGSVAGAGIGELQDQSRWMNPALKARDPMTFTHNDHD